MMRNGGWGWIDRAQAGLVRGIVCLGMLTLFGSASVLAQTDDEQERRPVDWSNFLDRFVAGDEVIHTISGNVTVELPDLRISAERIVFWVDRDSAPTLFNLQGVPQSLERGLIWPPRSVAVRSGESVRRLSPGLWELGNEAFGLVRAVYAEGNVILDSGTDSALQIEAESIAINFVEGSGVIRNGRVLKPLPVQFEVRYTSGIQYATRYEPILLEAAEIRLQDGSVFTAEDAIITTCEFGEPHYRLAGSSIRLEVERPIGAPAAPGSDRTPTALVEIDDLTLRVGDVPLFYLPSFGFRAERRYFPLESAQVGTESKFGTFLRTRWADDLSDNFEWRLNVDLFTKRGVGIGPGLGHRFDSGSARGLGYIETLWIADQGDDRSTSPTSSSPEPPDHRGRIRFQEFLELPGDIRVAAEVNYLSDSRFLDEYYERENRELRPPNTSLFVKHQRDNRALFLRADWRLNDFQTKTEYLPQLGGELISEPLLTLPHSLDFLNRGNAPNLYVDISGQVANVRTRASDELPQTAPSPERPRTIRSDVVTQFTLPLRLGFLRFGPFSAHQFTNYDHSVPDPGQQSSGDLSRYVGTAGVRASTEFHRVFEVDSELLGIHRLRHIITPDIRYTNRYDATQPSTDVLQFDAVDNIDEREVIRFGLRNVFQTKRDPRLLTGYYAPDGLEPPPLRTQTFLEADVEIDYFPEPKRDNRGFVWGPARYDVLFNPKILDALDMTFLAEGAWDLQAHDSETMNLDWRVYPEPEWSLRLGYRLAKALDQAQFAATERSHLRTVGEVLVAGADMEINEKWGVAFTEQYDLQASKFLRHQVQFRRLAHRWWIEFQLAFDEGTDNLSFQLAIYPTILLRKGRPPRTGDDPWFQAADPNSIR
ncbi:MAG: LPS assembly protein LptD [Planctomycetota bacterium]